MNANRLDFTYFDCTHADPGVDCAISVAAENTGQSQTTNRNFKQAFWASQSIKNDFSLPLRQPPLFSISANHTLAKSINHCLMVLPS